MTGSLKPHPTEVRAERKGAVLVITLDGPRSRNAIGPEIYDAVQAEVIEARRNQQVRAIVLTGARGFFSSGANIHSLQASAQGTLAEAVARTDRLNAMIRAIIESPKPVLAAVEGGAAGAGVSLALACDMIVAAAGAKMTVAYVRVGLSPDGGVTHFLRSALPRQLVMEMCTLGQPVPAERLAQFGIVNAIVPEGSALQVALEVAGRVAAGPAAAIARIKAQVNAAPSNELASHLNLEADGINVARFSAEAAEGLSAFLEKRRPNFTVLMKSDGDGQ